ncbi:MAG TPA: hypothetical protein VHK47_22850 [Polyangia bacterium]|nr:hypothetical protein [Polyangia bacterium]
MRPVHDDRRGAITQSFDAPGPTLTATLNGLPFNQALSISATAFGVACSALTPTSLATYLSDPQTATLTPGQTIGLSFTLRPTANVTASTDFLYVTLAPGSNDFGPVVIGQQRSPERSPWAPPCPGRPPRRSPGRACDRADDQEAIGTMMRA